VFWIFLHHRVDAEFRHPTFVSLCMGIFLRPLHFIEISEGAYVILKIFLTSRPTYMVEYFRVDTVRMSECAIHSQPINCAQCSKRLLRLGRTGRRFDSDHLHTCGDVAQVVEQLMWRLRFFLAQFFIASIFWRGVFGNGQI